MPRTLDATLLASLPGNMRSERMVALGKTGKNDQHGCRSLPGIAPAMDKVGGEKQAVARGEQVTVSLHQVLDIARQAEDELVTGVRHGRRTAVAAGVQVQYERFHPAGEFFPAQPLSLIHI